jgi:regulator of cell morphogenesis and NO signaling
MYQTRHTFIKAESRLADLIFENPGLLIVLEHFDIDYRLEDKCVEDICREHQINPELFIPLCNLYNGFSLHPLPALSGGDLIRLIRFLKNSHRYYKEEKFPQIEGLILQLDGSVPDRVFIMLKQFYQEYYEEVLEHLNYEDDVAFPYFDQLAGSSPLKQRQLFSVQEYQEHHTDIEYKLAELKQLMVKHLCLGASHRIRRSLIIALFELDFHLKVHSSIEEDLLAPLIARIESRQEDE